jgi:ribosomal protein L11 methyltransferase
MAHARLRQRIGAIAVAKLGASVDAVEIDDAAIAGAARNARFNGVVDRIVFTRRLEDAHGPYELIVANILCAVLLDHADRLVQRISPGGTLVLSGLVSTDVPAVSARFASLLFGRRPEVYERGDWRALVWRSG